MATPKMVPSGLYYSFRGVPMLDVPGDGPLTDIPDGFQDIPHVSLLDFKAIGKQYKNAAPLELKLTADELFTHFHAISEVKILRHNNYFVINCATVKVTFRLDMDTGLFTICGLDPVTDEDAEAAYKRFMGWLEQTDSRTATSKAKTTEEHESV